MYRILAIMAHPDDAEVWAGGTLAKYTSQGHEAHILVFTYNEQHIRGQEAKAGAEKLGCGLRMFGYRDTALQETEEATERVLEELERISPHALIVHNPEDTHPDHEAAFRIARRALIRWYAGHGRPNEIPSVFAASSYLGMGIHGPLPLDTFVDISSVWERKVEALKAHRSQGAHQWIARLRHAAELLGAAAGCPLAEGFRRLILFGETGCLRILDPEATSRAR